MDNNLIPISEVPKTLDNAIEKVISILKSEEIDKIKSLAKEELGEFHFTLGLWIRNNFRLLDKNSPLIKEMRSSNPKPLYLIDPDEISGNIIESVWLRLQQTKG